MKILYICTYYHRAMLFRDSMNYLESYGHHVIAFNAVAKGTKISEKYQSIMDDKVIHRECFNKLDRFFFHIKQKKIEKSIEKNININEYDVIHSHTLFNGGWAAYQLHAKHGIPYVVSVRNTDLNVFLKIPVFKRIARKILNSAAGILFLSATYKEQLLNMCFKESELEVIRKKCDVIPNGLEEFWLENKNCAKDNIHTPLEILCVGKVDKNKNMETALKVVEKLNTEGIQTHLTVIGQILDNTVKELLEHDTHTTVVPYLKKEELIQYYRNSDVFLMPSYRETFGRVYAEAMTQATPVIYTRDQGFDGIFVEGTVGYSVKADDIDEIIASVKKIIENYPAISLNCTTKCSIFNWSDISEHLVRFYLTAIKEKQ